MARKLSATKTIQIGEPGGDVYTLTFKSPNYAKIRAHLETVRGAGQIDAEKFGEKMIEETLDLLVDVEGAAILMEGQSEEWPVRSAMPDERVRQACEFCRQHQLDFYEKADGWKSVFVTFFKDVFVQASKALWNEERSLQVIEVR